MESTWSEEPEKRWTQQDTSDHFTDHGRLPDAEEKAARNAGGSNDNEELKKEPAQCTRAILGQAVPSGVEKGATRPRGGGR
jgi:hypothetical protein